MPTIDVTGENPIVLSYTIDPLSDELTLKISTPAPGSLELGQIVIEKVRFRALCESLVEISKVVTTNLDSRQRQNMLFKFQDQSAEISFG